jgi:protein-S-isoprenylcysteine O-methyltransferase Ste14
MGGLVPFLLTGWVSHDPSGLVFALGVLLLAIATAVLLHAFARFVMEGAGTPAPVAPTERLVIGGLYRHLRNPMYVGVTAMIVGQALLFDRYVLLAYAAVFLLVTMAFVTFYEEPTLRRQFGEQYDAYRSAVPGWWPRLRPWRDGATCFSDRTRISPHHVGRPCEDSRADG